MHGINNLTELFNLTGHTTVLTFIQLVESNLCNVFGRNNVLVAKFSGDRWLYNRSGDWGLDIKSVST